MPSEDIIQDNRQNDVIIISNFNNKIYKNLKKDFRP